MMLGITRQRINQVIREQEDVRAWAFYEGRFERAGYLEIAVNDLLRVEIVAAREFATERKLVGRQFESVHPAHAVFVADEQLKSSIRDPASLPKLFVKLARRIE